MESTLTGVLSDDLDPLGATKIILGGAAAAPDTDCCCINGELASSFDDEPDEDEAESDSESKRTPRSRLQL